MKKTVSVLLAALLLFACLPAVSAADIFGAPAVILKSETQTENDVIFEYDLDCGDAAGYERQRQEVYNRLKEQYGSDELARAALIAAGQEALLYPVMLMAEIEVGRITMLMGLYPVTGDSLRLTLCEDIFPAMETNNEFTGEAFDFRLHFKLIIKNDVEPTTASPEVSGETMHAPAAAQIRYEIEADAVNPNPSFLLLPYEDLHLKNPTRSGYIFSGWLNKATGTFVNTVPANTLNADLAAQWTPRTYTINYVLTTRPGSFIFADNSKNPVSYTCGRNTEIFALNTYNGYLFMGWYEDPDFKGTAVTVVGPDRRGDLILYAKWRTKAEADDELIRQKGWGDPDNDGKITAQDARLALRAAVGLEELTKAQIARIDFIGNGQISAATARQLLRCAVELDNMADVLRYYGLL